MVKLFVEGGGDARRLRTELREGFHGLLSKAGVRRMPRIIACGPRSQAFRDFSNERQKGPAVLLVDSEGPGTASPWEHVRRDVEKPPAATEEDLHFMAVTMETWLCSDPGALEGYYGQGFKAAALPQRPNLEEEPKNDVNAKLAAAVKASRKGRYNKGEDSFTVLGRIDPGCIAARCPRWGKRFLDAAHSW
ncbi:MAG: DUF4276 family protein [Deltaproteobacteria bacterium]|nr:DUF4276 family protein [Deltaproteobacteria bacterium]